MSHRPKSVTWERRLEPATVLHPIKLADSSSRLAGWRLYWSW